jgi:putative DNA primase/helicase
LSIDANAIVPAENGLLQLPTGKLFPATPKWFCFSVLGASYDPNAECPEWLQFIDQLWPNDQQSRDTLQEMFGYFLTADMSQQKSFMIIGPPRSGKGTIGRIIAALVGAEAVARPALADFAYQFGLEPLINKSVAIISDARLGNGAAPGLLAERLLAITGQDSISVSRKFLSAWNGTLRVRFLILSNELPHFSDASRALPSRFILLKTARSYLGSEDLNLYARLVEELPGILNWAIAGWGRLRERGHFIQPQSIQEMAEDFASMADPLSAFIEEACELGADKSATIGQLHRHYVDWCKGGAIRPSPPTVFGRDLRAAHPEFEFYRPHGEPRRIRGIAPSYTWHTNPDYTQGGLN